MQWLLRNELLIALHLRVRVVATAVLKRKVRKERKRKGGRRVSWQEPESAEGERSEAVFARRGRRRRPVGVQEDVEEDAEEDGDDEKEDDKEKDRDSKEKGQKWLAQSPEEMRARPPILEEGLDFDEELDEKMRRFESGDEGPDEGSQAGGEGDEESDEEEDWRYSIIPDPARADIRQRAWLQAMSVGKEPGLARRFEAINRYFDGRCADDEILFKAEISRKQLREVLHHYEEYVSA